MAEPGPDDGSYKLLLSSDTILESDFLSGRYAKKIHIYPNADKIWTFTDVQLFLNSLHDFCQPDRSRLYGEGVHSRITLKFVNRRDPKSILYFTYLIMTVAVEIEATMNWILSVWDKHVVEQKSFIGSQRRESVHSITRVYRYYTLTIDTSSDTSFAILNNLDPIYYDLNDFSACYHGFVSHFCTCKKIPWFRDNYDFAFMYEYYETFFSKNVNRKGTTYDCFVKKNQGYFKFIISEWMADDDDKYVSMIYKDKKYAILSGVYISPFAQSVCDNSDIVDGLLMDATWKTISGYVTSILMASVCNVGIPLGFSFGAGETKDLYNIFYLTFQEIINVDLSKYIVESDGGSALAAMAFDRDQFHLTCHHHYLRSLKSTEFSQQVGAITSCRCMIDLNNLIDIYSKEFASFINDSVKMELIQKCLLTCGMRFNTENQKIEVCDEERWTSVSLIERVKFKMPTTTNALESSHGHLNKMVTRRNDFYTSLSRLIEFTIEKTQNFHKSYITNFNRAKRQIIKHSSVFYQKILEKECIQYNSTHTSCECGETTLLSSMMRTDLPCSHRVHRGAKFNDPPDIKLVLRNNFNREKQLTIEYDEKERVSTTKSSDINFYINSKAVTTIRKFSSCKNVKIIKKSIQEVNVDEDDKFVAKMPLSFYSAVSDGIHQLHDYRKKKKNGAQSTTSSSCDEN